MLDWGILPEENSKGNDSVQVVAIAGATAELGLDICKAGQPEDGGDEVDDDGKNTKDGVQLAGHRALASIEPREDEGRCRDQDGPAGTEDNEDQDARGAHMDRRVDVALIGIPCVGLAITTPDGRDIGREAQLDNGKGQASAQQDIKGDMESQHDCRLSCNLQRESTPSSGEAAPREEKKGEERKGCEKPEKENPNGRLNTAS